MLHEDGIAQVFGRRDEGADHALKRPATNPAMRWLRTHSRSCSAIAVVPFREVRSQESGVRSQHLPHPLSRSPLRRVISHPNCQLDRLGVGVLLAGQRLEIEAGGGDALVAQLALDFADLGAVLLHGPCKGVA